ncbi:MAG: hypothetical protein Q7T55_03485 [Solirubrobacteraceae bacterium]|nr:hypothetical protein [Solirubrobacteraceae bacterium]
MYSQHSGEALQVFSSVIWSQEVSALLSWHTPARRVHVNTYGQSATLISLQTQAMPLLQG